MKLNFLLIMTVIFSMLSGILGAIFTYRYILPEEIKVEKNIELISTIEEQIESAYKDVSKSVVNIIVKKQLSLYRQDPFSFFDIKVGEVKQEIGGGTGFFITDDGILVTNRHVVEDDKAEYTVITSSGEELDGKVIYRDNNQDLALVKVDSDKYKKLEFVEANSVEIGQFAIAVGNTLAEFPNTVTFGILSGKNRQLTVEGGVVLSGLLQTDAAINPGNSGGPLVNLQGKVVGINTAIVAGSNGVGFAIPMTPTKIDRLLENIKN